MADPFRLNADYMKGTMYRGRRHYLHNDTNSLQPPLDFMTKKQARVALKVSRDKAALERVDFNHILVIKNHQYLAGKQSEGEIQHQKQNRQNAAAGNKKLVKKSKADRVVIETFSSLNPEDWTETIQAGCKIFINHSTGEVSDVCPWKVNLTDGDGSRSSSGAIVNNNNGSIGVDPPGKEDGATVTAAPAAGAPDEFRGTGALVYSSTEYQLFMQELEAMAAVEDRKKKGGHRK